MLDSKCSTCDTQSMATKYERVTYSPSQLFEMSTRRMTQRMREQNLPEITRTAALNYFVERGIKTWLTEIGEAENWLDDGKHLPC